MDLKRDEIFGSGGEVTSELELNLINVPEAVAGAVCDRAKRVKQKIEEEEQKKQLEIIDLFK